MSRQPWSNHQAAAEQVKADKLHALATLSRTRDSELPAVATAAESGFRDVAVVFWNGLFAGIGRIL
jgi:tripartite-type tricarboxylate transporter receptor subunit TctC